MLVFTALLGLQTLVYSCSGYVVTEPEAQNYFPATAMAALVDSTSAAGIGVSFVSSHGVSSLADGTLEVMLHRRFVDIGCRVDQGYQMDDQHIIVKTLRVAATTGQTEAVAGRPALHVATRLNAFFQQHPVEVFFAPAQSAPVARATAATVGTTVIPDLPPNVHLQTFRTSLSSDLRCNPFPPRICDSPMPPSTTGELTLLVRLQHLFSKEDDPAGLSQEATVDLAAWLAAWLGDAQQMQETTLTGGSVTDANAAAEVRLQPMQIRTFLVTVKLKKRSN